MMRPSLRKSSWLTLLALLAFWAVSTRVAVGFGPPLRTSHVSHRPEGCSSIRGSTYSTVVLSLFFGSPPTENDGPSSPNPSSSSSSSSSGDDSFIRPVLMADMGRASQILADGFFKGKANFFLYQWERLETYLSLESSYPKPNTLHQIYVACDSNTGEVTGLAEIDARQGTSDGAKGSNGPYMCNVAVARGCQRRGIATRLVQKCEVQVQEWCRQEDPVITTSTTTTTTPTTTNVSVMTDCSLYLKVRQSNQAAISMYDKLGYASFRQETEAKTGGTIIVMRKQLPRPEAASRSRATTMTAAPAPAPAKLDRRGERIPRS